MLKCTKYIQNNFFRLNAGIFSIYRVEKYLTDLSSFVFRHFSLAILSIILTFYPQVSSLKRDYDVSTSAIVPFNLRGTIECASYAESEHVKASHDSLRVRLTIYVYYLTRPREK